MMITDASLNREQICAASFNRWLWLRKESFGCLSKWFSTQIIVSLRWSCWNKTAAVRQHRGKVLYLVDDSLVAWVSCGPAGEAAIRDLHFGRYALITGDSSCCKGKGPSYFQDKWQQMSHLPVSLIKPTFKHYHAINGVFTCSLAHWSSTAQFMYSMKTFAALLV